jgi:hypothetical protein
LNQKQLPIDNRVGATGRHFWWGRRLSGSQAQQRKLKRFVSPQQDSLTFTHRDAQELLHGSVQTISEAGKREVNIGLSAHDRGRVETVDRGPYRCIGGRLDSLECDVYIIENYQ